MHGFWKKRCMAVVLVLVLLAGLCPAAQGAASGGEFVLAAVTEDRVLIEPEFIRYQAGQTLRQALLDSGHSFEGLEQGFISAVDGTSGGYFIYYDGGAYALDVPASAATGLLITDREAGWSEALQKLLVRMGQYRRMTNGVQNDPDAKAAYASGLAALQSGNEGGCLAALNEAISAFEEKMAGPKAEVTFRVTQGGAAVSNAHLKLTGVYQDEYTAEGTSIQVIPGSYSYVVSDGDCSRTEGTVNVTESGASVEVQLPSGKWFGDVDLLTESGGETAYAKTVLGSNRAAYVLPDYVSSMDTFLYAQQGPDVPDQKATRLRMCYTGLNGKDNAQDNKSWSSRTVLMAYLVDQGMDARTVELAARYEHPAGYVMYQTYTMELRRSPTLESLAVAGGGVRLPLDFSPDTLHYSVVTVEDDLTVTAVPTGGYALTVNGKKAESGVPVELSGGSAVQVTVDAGGGNSRTYTVDVVRKTAVRVTLRYAAGESIQVFNAGGFEVPAASAAAGKNEYRLAPGEAYTYRTTKSQYYHAEASFEAAEGLELSAASPLTEDWLTVLDAANGTTAARRKSAPYAFSPAFSPAIHAYTVPVSDSNSAFGLWVELSDEAGDASIKAVYSRISNGRAYEIPVTSGSPGGKNLLGLVEVSGFSNTATVLVSRKGSGVTYSQEYVLEVRRTLHLSGLTLAADGGAAELTPSFDRDVLAYTAQVPQGAAELLVGLRFPITVSGGTYGGYTAELRLDGQSQTVDYVHDDPAQARLVLDPAQAQQTLEIVLRHSGSENESLYRIVLDKVPPVNIRFQINAENAVVNLTDEANGVRAWPDAAGSYALLQGHSYRYTVSAVGYVAAGGQLTADTSRTVEISLQKAAVNPDLNPELPAQWPDFRGSETNNGVTDAPIPTDAEDAALYWANQLGVGYSAGAVGSPILVDGYVYTYAGETLFKVDAVTGEVVAKGSMVRSSSFAINSPTYAQGMIFVGLSNGGVQAFDAVSLKSLWLYEDPLGGQPNCPIAYKNGCIYTGFWNGETMNANLVCLTVTDEDPSSETEAKQAAWTHTVRGGFYWAGALVTDRFLLVGTDDGESGYVTGHASLLSLDPATGCLIDSVVLPGVGDVRCSVMYDDVTDRYYFTSKGGDFYQVQVDESGAIQTDSLRRLVLSNGSENQKTPAMSTSTPVVYNGRAYVGVCGTSQFGQYTGHNMTVIDLKKWTVAYQIPTQGYPQTSGLLTTAGAEEDGTVYVYFFDNYTPGKLRVLDDKPGQTSPGRVTREQYTESGKTHTVQTGYVLFTPDGAQAQYAICSPIADEYGTVYFKNDSAYLMALGSRITELTITSLPDKTAYREGETFEPAGMTVTATYANGKTRDVTDYVSWSSDPLTAEDTEFQIRFEHLMYQDRDGLAGQQVTAPAAVVDLEIEPSDHVHAYGPWEACGDGTHRRSCACGAAETEDCTLESVGSRPASCREDGFEELQCMVCGGTIRRVTDAAGPEHCPSAAFRDLKTTAWYHDNVDYVLIRGMMSGNGDGTFAPEKAMTRAEVVSILYRLAGRPGHTTENPFADVRGNVWYGDAVLWAYESGVVYGTSETQFSPNDRITREQLVTFLYRYAQWAGLDTEERADLSVYKDLDRVSGYARTPMAWAVGRGLLYGETATTLAPKGGALRCQVAAILQRFLVQYRLAE